MWNLAISCLIFIVSLLVLLKAADYFTIAAEKIGLFFGLNSFFIGVTIVSIGTSLPELFAGLFAVFKDSSEIVIGNVVGSNIANILWIVGSIVLFSKETITINYKSISVDLNLLVMSSLFFFLVLEDGYFSLGEAILFLSSFIIYIIYTVQQHKTLSSQEKEEYETNELEIPEDMTNLWREILILVISGLFISLGANFTIDAVIAIAENIAIGKDIIALSVVAVGTSLPEFAVSVTAAFKNKPDISLGNIVGSNIFNTFVVMGIPGLITPLNIPANFLVEDIPVMIAATILLFLAAQSEKITRWQGIMFLVLYLWFIGTNFEIF